MCASYCRGVNSSRQTTKQSAEFPPTSPNPHLSILIPPPPSLPCLVGLVGSTDDCSGEGECTPRWRAQPRGWCSLTPGAGGARKGAVQFHERDSPGLSRLFIHCSLWEMGANHLTRGGPEVKNLCRKESPRSEAYRLNPWGRPI